MQESESQKLATEVKIERRGRPKSIKVIDEPVVTVGLPELNGVKPVKPIGNLGGELANPDSAIARAFPFRPKDPKYTGWIPMTAEEAEEFGLKGMLSGHHPGLGIGLLRK